MAEGVSTDRPAEKPGPRCVTHHRVQRKKIAAQKHASHVKIAFGAEPGWYDRMREFQGGRCAICPRALGISKRLAVDHDHKLEGTEEDAKRGLLCGNCNSMLAHCRDDIDMLVRAVRYLQDPPARRMREGRQ